MLVRFLGALPFTSLFWSFPGLFGAPGTLQVFFLAQYWCTGTLMYWGGLVLTGPDAGGLARLCPGLTPPGGSGSPRVAPSGGSRLLSPRAGRFCPAESVPWGAGLLAADLPGNSAPIRGLIAAAAAL